MAKFFVISSKSNVFLTDDLVLLSLKNFNCLLYCEKYKNTRVHFYAEMITFSLIKFRLLLCNCKLTLLNLANKSVK